MNADIVAVNTSHNVADGSYLKRAVSLCLSDSVDEPHLYPTPINETYKAEIERSKKFSRPMFPYRSCTGFPIDPNHPDLAPTGTHCIYWTFRLQAHELNCFDKYTKRMKNLSEALWIAKSLALGTRGKSVDILAIPTILDLRRYVDPKRINNTCLNNVGSTNLAVKTSPTMKLSEVAKKFRSELMQDEAALIPFLSITSSEYWLAKPNFCYGNVSNLGVITLTPPLKDVYINSKNNGYGVDNQIFTAAFSVATPFRNELRLLYRFSPHTVPVKEAHIIAQSFLHILRHIPFEMTIAEAHQETEAFQARLDLEY
jgi:hypothetical protein